MTEPPREPTSRTLASFLSGESSPAESAEVIRWAQSSPECAARLDEMRAAWDHGTGNRQTVGSWDVDQIWNAIAPRLDGEEHPPLRLVEAARAHHAPVVGITRRHNVAGWIAAAACGVLLTGVWADQRIVREQARHTAPKRETVREYRTDRGQRASVTLPDGSAFQLGPLSVLRVSSTYGAPARTVELEGDGYFNVTHDAAHPFSVRTARTTIRDIGTRFIVRARPTERRVEIAVADGKVSIEPRQTTSATTDLPRGGRDSLALMIGAGQAALVDDRGKVTLLPRASVSERFAWTRGEFVFNHVLVPNVLSELSRWYNNTFVLADKSLDTVRLTTVLRGETLLEALVVLETSLDVDARVSGDTVTLTRHIKREGRTP